jgi:hypothetical protein
VSEDQEEKINEALEAEMEAVIDFAVWLCILAVVIVVLQ